MITQDDVLKLAETAGDNDQRRIKEILLAVAGMIDNDGMLVDEPDVAQRWQHVMASHGQYGRGCRALERKTEKDIKGWQGLARLMFDRPKTMAG